MPYDLTEEMRDDVFRMSAEDRYHQFVIKAIEHNQVWALQGDDGFAMFRDNDGTECIPFWPHPDFAIAMASGDWSDCEPRMIALESFMTRWLPGMQQDERKPVVFPAPLTNGYAVSPDDLLQDLMDEMSTDL